MPRRSAAPHSGPNTTIPVLRALVSLSLAVTIIVLSFSVTLGQIGKGASTPWPIRFPKGDGRIADVLPTLTGQTTPGQLAAAVTAAQAVLDDEPTSLVALRVLGLARSLQSQPGAAERVFGYAETLSRRDVVTQLWLIEHKVGLGDIAAALTHYDRAMRTSASSRKLLIPILGAAANDRAVAGPLSSILAQRPNWWFDYMNQTVGTIQSPASLFLLAQSVALRPQREDERVLLAGIISRLLQLQAPSAAARLYTDARRINGVNLAMVRDGAFETDPMLPPIDWSLAAADGAAAVREPHGGRPGNALGLHGSSDRPFAFQVLVLKPGSYRLRLIVGDVAGGTSARPRVEVQCLGGAMVGSSMLIEAPSEGRLMTVPIEVPNNCITQTVTFYGGGEAADSEPTSWIDDVRIDRAGTGRD